MKQEIEKLQANEVALQDKLIGLMGDKQSLQASVAGIQGENSALKAKIEELTQGVENLQAAEGELKGLVDELNQKVQAGADKETKEQLTKLEKLQSKTQQEIENLVSQLGNLEMGLKQCSTFGIFSYIIEKDDQATFIKTVEDAVAEDMTYAQINEYLTGNLSPELDKIIKDHPSLTKTYIRNLRKE